MRYLVSSVMIALVGLGGCASAPPSKAEMPATVRNTGADTDNMPTAKGDYDAEAEAMFRILAGELAAQAGRLEEASRYYLEAAEATSDPAIARRATRFAFAVDDNDRAVRAARRWTELQDSSAARQSYAMALVRSGETQAAVAELEAILDGEASLEQGFRTLVGLFNRDADLRAALPAFDRLRAKRGDNPQVHLFYGLLAQRADADDQALEALNRAIALDPDLTRAQILRAQILIDQGRNRDAVKDLRAAVEGDPDNQELRRNYAQLLTQIEAYARAQEQFEILREADPEADPEATRALALIALELDQYERAEQEFQALVDQGAQIQESRYYLGWLAERQDRIEQALQRYAAVDSGEFYFDAQLRRARLLGEQERVNAGRELVQRLRERYQDPNQVALIEVTEGELLELAGRLEEARQVYEGALDDYPDNVQLLYANGLLAQKMGEFPRFEQTMRRILEVEPDNVNALNALGYTLADRDERLDEAKRLVRRAFELQPDDPAIIDSMGWVEYRLGHTQKALEYLREAYEQMPDGEIAAHLGEVLWVLGQPAEGRAIWEEALEQDPDNRFVRETMERLVDGSTATEAQR